MHEFQQTNLGHLELKKKRKQKLKTMEQHT